MISFYPGPSRLNSNIPAYMHDACESGILSENHRSEAFVNLTQECIQQLHLKLNIPEDYKIYFTSSATECWNILAKSFPNYLFTHLYNGAFGEKWYETNKSINKNVKSFSFDLEEVLPLQLITPESNVICITQNETSNGTQVSNVILNNIRKQFPKSLIMVDATSSIGGIDLDFKSADVWFASVQKCFGMPAGLGLLILSPQAVESAVAIGVKSEYNNICNLEEKMTIWQTTHTPNVLGIYLLKRIVKEMENVSVINKILKLRAEEYFDFCSKRNNFQLLIKNKVVQSDSVIALTASEDFIKKIKKEARVNNLIIGNGYGRYASTTFRIANFPQLLNTEISILKDFLYQF